MSTERNTHGVRTRQQIHLKHRGKLNRKGRALRRSMKEFGGRGRIHAKSKLSVTYKLGAVGTITGITFYRTGKDTPDVVCPDEVLAPGVNHRRREEDRAMVRSAVRGAGGSQPWLLPSPEGLEAIGRAARGPRGRPIPNNPDLRRKR